MIERNIYIKKIKKYIDLDLVKVITWIRRCWKTYFMKQIIQLLIDEKKINPDNIIFIDKESLEFDFIKDYNDLYKYIEEKKSEIDWKIYLFVDEIQDIDSWEKTIRNYAKDDLFDIYITWSNSNLLSSELSTFLTWRYIEIHIFPLNFKEFLKFRNKFDFYLDTFWDWSWVWYLAWSWAWNSNWIWYWMWEKEEIKEEFQNYIKYGWFPAIHNMNFNNEMIYAYLSWVFNSILLKDIVSRYNIRNSNLLLDVFKFTWDNIGNIVSSKKIVDYLRNQKIWLSLDTLKEYLTFFQNTFLLNKVQRYDLKWKKILDLYEKYYLWDLWFRNYLLWFKQGDIAQYIENIVYLELKVRWYEVFIWKIWDLEIDFIAKKDWKIEYYQVCYLLATPEVIKREFWNLEKIKDNYKKTVLSLDDFFQNDYNWIERKNLIDWCLE